MQLDDDLRRLAARQHGVLSREQVLELGATPRQLAHRLSTGEWQLVSHRVLSATGSPTSFEQRCLAAVLDCGTGAVLSHEAAAALLGVPGFDRPRLHVSRPRTGTSRTTVLAQLHDVTYLPDHHMTVVRAVPVTTVARTLFDLAGSVHPARTARAGTSCRWRWSAAPPSSSSSGAATARR